ncbi:MAG: thymidylate synthase [Eubacteriales bacterium]|nr:thymidylate synthase [Eubacteriales bacterium]MDD4541434.1 thymidylate synthase [Eubacteriales bacterium]
MSRCDEIFRDNIQDILQNGCSDEGQKIRPRWEDGSPAHTVKRFGLVNRYDLSQEFPIMTLRRVFYKSAVEELLWIWQKKSNRVDELSTGIWDQWKLPDGTIGKAYGYQLAQKHKYKEGMFDQVDRVLYDLKHNPYSRRMIVSMFNHADLSEMALYPCAYSMTFNVCNNKLNAILNQRSNDMLVANHWNVTQYAVLLAMFAQVSDLEPGELVHVIADAHIYDRHIPIVKEVIEREAFPAPKLVLDTAVKNFYDFTVDSVSFENYQHGALVKDIPVAI